MGHDTLSNHYMTNFAVMQHHKWSLTEMDNLIPWERYAYIDLLAQWLKEEKDRIKNEENERMDRIRHFDRQRASRQKAEARARNR